MGTRAWLSGDDVDLSTLKRNMPAGTTRVDSDGEGHYLTGAELDGLSDDPERLQQEAENLLRRINGLARTIEPGFRPVKLSGKYLDDASGKRQTIVALGVVDIVVAGMPVEAETGSPRPAPPGIKYAELMSDRKAVSDVMWILGTPAASLTG